jgi:hypothetical protein
MKKILSIINLLIIVFFTTENISAQCCAGGSGSPIAGGASQGVLQDKQLEINSNFQYINTTKFYSGDTLVDNFLDRFSSSYSYTRIAFGLSKNFTMSVETGYWFNKTQVGLNKSDTIISQGIGDLILFPRYDVINITKDNKKTELTLGMGVKIPIGSYNDSIGSIEPFSGQTYYIPKPLVLQASSGSHDYIFYAFFFRGYTLKKFSLFANAIYIKKGWNPIGEKVGDYARIGLFATKTIKSKLGLTLQVSGEWIDKMKINEDILMFAYPNYDPEATGSKKIFIVPQINYTFKCNITIYGLCEIPVYQYITKTQIGSEYQATAGFSYRFLTKKITAL